MGNTINGTTGNDLFAARWGGPVPKGYHLIGLDDYGDVINPNSGNDIIDAGVGDDVINFRSYLTSADRIDGQAGYNTITLSGDYSGGLILTGTFIKGISEFQLFGGHSYNLTFADSAVTNGDIQGSQFVVDGSTLKSTDVLTLDASRELSIGYDVRGGAGDDTITTGHGNDTIATGAGNNIVNAGGGDDIISDGPGHNTLYGGSGFNIYELSGAHDVCYGGSGRDIFESDNVSVNEHFDGGSGDDALEISSQTKPLHLVFNAQTMVNVETLLIGDNYGSIYLKLDDANVAAGKTLKVEVGASPGYTATFDGSAETDGKFIMDLGPSTTAIGGLGNDTFGADMNTDHVDGGGGYNVVNVDQPAVNTGVNAPIVLGPDSLKNIQKLVLPINYGEIDLTMNNANVVAGKVMEIDARAVFQPQQFVGFGLQFDGSAETDGSFSIQAPSSFAPSHLIGSSGNDVISFVQINSNVPAFLASDSIDGGPGSDTLSIDADLSAAVVFTPTTMTNIETLKLSSGHSYNLTTDDATVATGATLTVIASGLGANDHLTFNGAAETDGHFKIVSGLDGDNLTGGALSDTFVYTSAAQSSGAQYDAIHNINFALDKLDVGGAITAVDTAVHAALSTASFDTDLSAAVSGHLVAGSAMLVTANTGTLYGQVFLVVDQNGVTGYQSGEDLVIRLAGHSGTLATGDFI